MERKIHTADASTFLAATTVFVAAVMPSAIELIKIYSLPETSSERIQSLKDTVNKDCLMPFPYEQMCNQERLEAQAELKRIRRQLREQYQKMKQIPRQSR